MFGNGASFDNVILGEAYKRCGLKVPWNFWNDRCLRTLMDIGGVKSYELPQDKKHNALYDCYRQIVGYNKAMKNLGKYD
jgi:exodeoxyribonuclease VIII